MTVEDLLLLLAVRLRSRGTHDVVAATAGTLGLSDSVDVVAALGAAERAGWVRHRGDERRWSLTSAGEAELAAYLALERDDAGRADLTTAYEAFLPLNRDFLAVISSGAPEDALTALIVLVVSLDPILDALTGRLSRFGAYRSRFVATVERAHSDVLWIASPQLDSIHTIWFELHEHLLATLGRDRTSELGQRPE